MSPTSSLSAEHQRLAEAEDRSWRKWGPYLSDRAWASVREDYSADGDAWASFTHDDARKRAFRWSEDGIAGFCDDHQNLCMSLALWNGRDPILKERFFGLTGREGNHGEDVKELYFYLDCTPTSSYARMLYRYPQAAYPYGALIDKNRGRQGPEWELFDELAQDFADGRYFDVTVEYAKADPEEILCRVRARNCGPDPAPLHLLPQLWYRNQWSWSKPAGEQPMLRKIGDGAVATSDHHPYLPQQWWYAQDPTGAAPELLFTNNESNAARLGWTGRGGTFFKDAFHVYLISAEHDLADHEMGQDSRPSDWINAQNTGSKVAAHFQKTLAPGETWELQIRLSLSAQSAPFGSFDSTFAARASEADQFYAAIQAPGLSADDRTVQRQALAGLLWSRQFYRYPVETWLVGDPASPQPPASRWSGRNSKWRQLDAGDVILMPDTWEYPWFAAWDLAFHCVAISLADPDLAKSQLLLLLREYYMHPSGQLPAYEWEFSDLNPPVTAWAGLQIYRRDKAVAGKGDLLFLERVFQKLLINFTWWVNREDVEGDNLFEGGFLGLDNISIIDRSALHQGERLQQADATAWVAMYCAQMLAIAVELARAEPQYQDLAIKFLDHYAYIARALVNPQQIDPSLEPLWDAQDGFFYDHLYPGAGRPDIPLRIRSLVGLIPLLASQTLESSALTDLPELAAHHQWLLDNRPELLQSLGPFDRPGAGDRLLLSVFTEDMLRAVVEVMLDESRMLSRYGIRSLSKEHGQKPFCAQIDGQSLSIGYEPAEAVTQIKGGNSNWRGPIWMPANFLLTQALLELGAYYGPSLQVSLRTADGAARRVTLTQAAAEIASRVKRLFSIDAGGRRPIYGDSPLFTRSDWRDALLFHEYFHAEDGRGLGAGHQTGWTALIATFIQDAR